MNRYITKRSSSLIVFSGMETFTSLVHFRKDLYNYDNAN